MRVEVMTSGNSQFKNRALVSTTDHTDFTDTGLCKIHYLSVKSVVKKRDNARCPDDRPSLLANLQECGVDVGLCPIRQLDFVANHHC